MFVVSIKDDYYIKEIDYNTAESIVVKCHYAHRKAPYTHAFGLFSKSPNKIVGVVIYGSPASHSLCESLCGWDERYNIYELTRLYVDDGLPKNLESFLVGNTIKLLDKEIIVSYSDTKFGHVGLIYQSTNFYYTGMSKGGNTDFEEIDEDGTRLHNKSLTERYGNVDGIRAAMASGRNIYEITRSSKHRYVYFNCNKKRKKELLQKLAYPIQPYPKSTSHVPITSVENIDDNKPKKLF